MSSWRGAWTMMMLWPTSSAQLVAAGLVWKEAQPLLAHWRLL